MNDGNYSFIQYQNSSGTGPIERIDVFRASQPSGGFGVAGSGTTVQALCSQDHLAPGSNKVFRALFSRGSDATSLPALLETREVMNPAGLPDGSWEERLRDVDSTSPSYGSIMRIVASPNGDGSYNLVYEVRTPAPAPAPGLPSSDDPATPGIPVVPIASPLTQPVSQQNTALVDLAVPVSQLPPIDPSMAGNPLNATVRPDSTRAQIDSIFQKFTLGITSARFATWRNNFYIYESFGDVGLKATHPGTNLIGPAPSVSLISELLVFRAYR